MTDPRPSIAELQNLVGINSFYPHSVDELIKIRNAAPVLLEIAAAALAWAEAFDEAHGAAYMATAGADHRPARERLAIKSAELQSALRKVHP